METPIMIRVLRVVKSHRGTKPPTRLVLPPKMRDKLRAESLRWSEARGAIREELLGDRRRTFKFWGLDVHSSAKAKRVQVQ